MLDSHLKTQLHAYLERVTLPFEIEVSLDQRPESAELLERRFLALRRPFCETTTSGRRRTPLPISFWRVLETSRRSRASSSIGLQTCRESG